MKHINTKTFFSEEEKIRIREAVRSVEKTTSGEIATMVVDQSDRYLEAEVLGGALVSGLAALILCVFLEHVTIWTYVPITCLLYIPARLLIIRFPRLKLPFINKGRLAETIRDRAVRAFYERGLFRTREENGILIFISILERRVWILGDRGVNLKIPQENWLAHASEISAGIREGRGCDALCRVIGECGQVLAANFPHRADDTNELPDELIC